MTTTQKVWGGVWNTAFSSAVDQAVQYREGLFALKQQLVAAGGVVELSCNGTVADTADNWASAADVVFGTATSQPMAYVVIRKPDAWGTPPTTAARERILLVANNSNADATPQTIDTYRSPGAYSLVGTPLQNRPTTAAGEVSRTTFNFIPWAAPTGGYWNCWRTTDGDLYFGIKQAGSPNFRMWLHWVAPSVTGVGAHRGVSFGNTQASDLQVLTWANLGALGNWRGFTAAGAIITSGVLASSPASNMSLWPGGAESTTGAVPNIDAHLNTNVVTVGQQRYFGLWPDVFGAPDGAPFNEVIDGDPDAIRLVCLGALWLPIDRNALPLL